jgi:ElaA protein
MPKIEMEWQRFEALTAAELYELLRFRQNIFVVEQHSPYPDLDGLDQSTWHLLLRVDAQLSGYLRLLPIPGPAPVVRIGRVAVSSHLRRRGFGGILMQQALLLCRERFPSQPIVLSAQLHLVAFYEGFSFTATSEPYEEFGVLHVDMLAPGFN